MCVDTASIYTIVSTDLAQRSKHGAFTQCCFNVGPMLDQRRRRWTNIETALGGCPVFAGSAAAVDSLADSQQTRPTNCGLMLGQRRRRWTSIEPLLLDRVGLLELFTIRVMSSLN